ncbi:MAG: hypothetical protein AMXMBFR33_43790 [Candidatus Xenobia bacterium]|jgi:hypothetical protein
MGSLFRSKFDPEDLARRASEAPSVEEGLRILSVLPSRAEFSNSDDLQTAFAMGLVNLTARSDARQAAEILEKILALPFYQRNQGARLHHSSALAHAAREMARRDMQKGAAIAALIPRVPGYRELPELQVAHARALFQVGAVSEEVSEILPLATLMRTIPLFDQIGEIQFEYAKLMSNAVAYSPDAESAGAHCESIQQLTGFHQFEFLQEAYARACRNRQRKESEGPRLNVQVQVSPQLQQPGPDPLWFQAVLRVTDPGGGPVYFRDESESVVQIVAGKDEEQARHNALAAYRAMLESGGHRVSPEGIVDGSYRMELVTLRPVER